MTIFSPQQLGVHAKKSLGQHFLCDTSVLDDMLRIARLQHSDTVLEIGPGLGVLTLVLAQHVARVIAIEKDSDLLSPLQHRLQSEHITNVMVLQGDILRVHLEQLLQDHRVPSTYCIVANLPYLISSRFFRLVFDLSVLPRSITVLVQKEVAQRCTAPDGEKSMLSLLIQTHARATLGPIVLPAAFCPPPKVDSAILHLDVFPKWTFQSTKEDFFRIAKIGFSAKRKQLLNTLSSGLHLPKDVTANLLQSCGIDPARRAETLSLQEWDALTVNVTHSAV